MNKIRTVSKRLGKRLTKRALRSGPPSPPGWRNEPHALSHPFPACSAPACSSTEPPCCWSETLGCQRETGAEIRDHPPSPPVSVVSVSVGIGQGCLNLRGGWILSLLWPERAKMTVLCGLSGCLSFSPPSSRCVGLPLQTAHGPLLASASREPVGLQGRQTGRKTQVFKYDKNYGGRSR